MNRWARMLIGLGWPIAACSSFRGEDADPAFPDGGDASGLVDALSDGGEGGALRCRGPFGPSPRTVTVDATIGTGLVSLRGTTPDHFIVSYDKSPDTQVTAGFVERDVLRKDPVDAFAALPKGAPIEDRFGTVSATLDVAVFASDRPLDPDAGAPGPMRLWIARRSGAGGYPPAKYLAVEENGNVDDAMPRSMPYFAGERLYYVTGEEIRAGSLSGATLKGDGRALADGTGPVVSGDELELVYKTATEVVRAVRASTSDVFVRSDTVVATPDAPSWLSPDGCELWVVHFPPANSGIGRQVHVYARPPR